MSHNENQSLNIINKLSTALRRGKMMDTVTTAPGKSRSKVRANTFHSHIHSQNTKTKTLADTVNHARQFLLKLHASSLLKHDCNAVS